MRMSMDTFDYIKYKIEYRIQKQWCNLHKQPVLPEERLVGLITLRFALFKFLICVLFTPY